MLETLTIAALGAALLHQARTLAAAQEGAGEVHADDAHPVVVGGVEEGVDRADAGAVDQYVEAAEALGDGGEGRR